MPDLSTVLFHEFLNFFEQPMILGNHPNCSPYDKVVAGFDSLAVEEHSHLMKNRPIFII